MITSQFLEKQRLKMKTDSVYQMIRNNRNEQSLARILFNPDYEFSGLQELDYCLKPHSVKNQGISGRCWLFAGLNCLRYQFEQENYPVDLSAVYLYFFDLLEKANYFLEYIIRNIDAPIDDRTLQYFLDKPVQDNGQWTMFSNIVEKYGVVPESAMPENDFSKDTRSLIFNLCDVLRFDAYRIRKSYGCSADMKEEMLSDIYRLLSIYLGEPPGNFIYRSFDTMDGTFCRYTPTDFQKKYFPINRNDFINIIHVSDRNELVHLNYRLKNIGNIVGMPEISYVSVSMNKFKKYVLHQLSDGHPVWFGCDTKVCFDRRNGIMDLDMYNFNNFLHFPRTYEKIVLLDYHLSKMNHAMVFTGVKLKEGIPKYWNVENSVGCNAGNDGYFIMKDDWFDQYVYQAVIHKEYILSELPDIMTGNFDTVEPWSPISTLALTN